MRKLIELGVAIDAAIGAADEYDGGYNFERDRKIRDALMALPTVDAVEVVRCKDCKHRPTGADRDDLEFPDDKCPCKCEDYWYSWKPEDEWYCGNGERKDGEGRDSN